MPTSSPPELSSIGVIGGSGLYTLGFGSTSEAIAIQTPYSELPVRIFTSKLGGKSLYFLPRHGELHSVLPHLINYRANVWALNRCSPGLVLAVNTVGCIADGLGPGTIVFPDQLIDYTYGRESTFGETGQGLGMHIDFTYPYDLEINSRLAKCAHLLGIKYRLGGVYGCTQGPRLETAAEIRRMQVDGCDIVGMTGMPEAILARELKLRYSSIALVVNDAAGLADGPILLGSIEKQLAEGMLKVRALVQSFIEQN